MKINYEKTEKFVLTIAYIVAIGWFAVMGYIVYCMIQ